MAIILGVSFAFTAAFGLATQAIFIRQGTQEGRAIDALLIVLIIDILIFAPYAGVKFYPNYGLNVTSLLAFTVAGLLIVMIGRAFLYEGIQRIGASRAEPLKATQALPAALLGILLFGETATLAHLVGIALIIIGVTLISMGGTKRLIPDSESQSKFGVLLVLGSALAFGLEAVIAFFLYLWIRDDFPETEALVNSSARWFAAAGISSAVFLFSLYAGLRVADVALVMPLIQTSPLLVAGLSYVFLQDIERVNMRLVVGAGIIVIGTIAITLLG